MRMQTMPIQPRKWTARRIANARCLTFCHLNRMLTVAVVSESRQAPPSGHGTKSTGMVFHSVQLLQNLARGIEDPIQQKREKQQTRKTSRQDKPVFWIPKSIADGAHGQGTDDRRTTGEKQDYAGDRAMLGFAKAAD